MISVIRIWWHVAKVMIEEKLFVIINNNSNKKKENKNATTTIVHIWGGWVKSKLHCLKWTEEVKDRSSSPMAWTNTKRKIEMRDTLRVCLCVCEWVSVWMCVCVCVSEWVCEWVSECMSVWARGDILASIDVGSIWLLFGNGEKKLKERKQTLAGCIFCFKSLYACTYVK